MPASARTTTSYGSAHQQRRVQLLAQLRDGDPCARCRQPMYRGQDLHADHVTQPMAYGPGLPDALSHARCNLSHGAQLGNRIRGHTTRPQAPTRRLAPRTSRAW